MERELKAIFDNIKSDIKDENIQGYKNLLFTIYSSNKLEDEHLQAELKDFINLLFNEGYIKEEQNCSCKDGACSCKNKDKKQIMVDAKTGEKIPIDAMTLNTFSNIISSTMNPMIHQRIAKRFTVKTTPD